MGCLMPMWRTRNSVWRTFRRDITCSSWFFVWFVYTFHIIWRTVLILMNTLSFGVSGFPWFFNERSRSNLLNFTGKWIYTLLIFIDKQMMIILPILQLPFVKLPDFFMIFSLNLIHLFILDHFLLLSPEHILKLAYLILAVIMIQWPLF